MHKEFDVGLKHEYDLSILYRAIDNLCSMTISKLYDRYFVNSKRRIKKAKDMDEVNDIC